MQFSKTEILILEMLAKGNKRVESIAFRLGKSQRTVYDRVKKLQNKGFIELKSGYLKPREGLHVTLFLQALTEFPNPAEVLAGSGVPILTALLEPSGFKQIAKNTGFKKSTIYNKINQSVKRSLVKQENGKYMINEKLWAKLAEALRELDRYDSFTDQRVPVGSIIYYKNSQEILFSCKEEVNATKTAFSAYKYYGINLKLTKHYYYLPHKKLTKNQIMKHSLIIAEKEQDVRLLVFVALFYAKFRRELRLKHKMLKNLDRVLTREYVEAYPTYKEIQERAEVYNIKV